MSTPKPVVLCILDGWGLSDRIEANAPYLADTPTFDAMMAHGPQAQLITHGPDVGLPVGQMGNSEVGHTNIGAGRVVSMDLGQIDLAIQDGSYAANPQVGVFIRALQASGGTAHLLGVVSDGGVHGHMDHIVATARLLVAAGVPCVVHAITDGRDVAPKSADVFLPALMAALPDAVRVVTVIGRYFALDRDNRWARVQTAYDAIANGRGVVVDQPLDAVTAAYAAGTSDEFIPASVVGDYAGLAPQDGVFCLNFRADRARELLEAIAAPEFTGFDRGLAPRLAARLGMVKYSDAHNAWYRTVFPKRDIVNTLPSWVAQKGLRQFHLAETEKYPHVTFFLAGGREAPEPGEDRQMPHSPAVATYDLQPEMSSQQVTELFVDAIEARYDLIVVNYANPDMVGHTGDLQAAILACEAVDRGLARVVAALDRVGGAMIVTADHGNCEVMVDPETGQPHTSHTLNLVPVILVGGPEDARLRDGRLADLAPTLLSLMGLDTPPEMTGRSLLLP